MPTYKKILLFVGTTVPYNLIPNRTRFEILPPVKRGDFGKLKLAPGDEVVLIDGEFLQNLSVTPKEILALLGNGIKVYGASSMGALRAVELSSFGMIGYGWVYQAYKSGYVMKEDEVALLYDPGNYLNLSIPLINIRYWLLELTKKKALNTITANKILQVLGNLYFGYRSINKIENVINTVVNPNAFNYFKSLTKGGISDIKRLDALNLLQLLTSKGDSL